MPDQTTQHFSYDQLWKSIIQDLFKPFMGYFFGQYAHLYDLTQPITFLDAELAKLQPDSVTKNRLADRLVRIVSKAGKELWLYIHIEVQGYRDHDFDERMYDMKCRLREKYGKNVVAIAILTDKHNNFRPGVYQEELFGKKTTYEYHTFKLKDYQPEALLQGKNPFGYILQTVWYQVFGSSEDQEVLATKKTLINQLMRAGLPKEQVGVILEFMVYYANFKHAPNHKSLVAYANKQLKIHKGMGIQELVATKFHQIGKEEGKAEGRVDGLKTSRLVFNALQSGTLPQDIASQYDLPLQEVLELKATFGL